MAFSFLFHFSLSLSLFAFSFGSKLDLLLLRMSRWKSSYAWISSIAFNQQRMCETNLFVLNRRRGEPSEKQCHWQFLHNHLSKGKDRSVTSAMIVSVSVLQSSVSPRRSTGQLNLRVIINSPFVSMSFRKNPFQSRIIKVSRTTVLFPRQQALVTTKGNLCKFKVLMHCRLDDLRIKIFTDLHRRFNWIILKEEIVRKTTTTLKVNRREKKNKASKLFLPLQIIRSDLFSFTGRVRKTGKFYLFWQLLFVLKSRCGALNIDEVLLEWFVRSAMRRRLTRKELPEKSFLCSYLFSFLFFNLVPSMCYRHHLNCEEKLPLHEKSNFNIGREKNFVFFLDFESRWHSWNNQGDLMECFFL